MADLEMVTYHLHYFSDDDVLAEKRTVELSTRTRKYMTKYLYEDKDKRYGYVDVYEHRADCKDECWLTRRELKTLDWYDKYGWSE